MTNDDFGGGQKWGFLLFRMGKKETVEDLMGSACWGNNLV